MYGRSIDLHGENVVRLEVMGFVSDYDDDPLYDFV